MRKYPPNPYIIGFTLFCVILIVVFAFGTKFHAESVDVDPGVFVMRIDSSVKEESEISLIVPRNDTMEESSIEELPTEESLEFDLNIDYWNKLAEFLAAGDEYSAREAERLGRLKAEHLGTDETVSYDELLLLARVVETEAGSDWLTEEHRRLVASVVLNRMSSPEFPDTMYDVIYQKNQYASAGTEQFEACKPSETSIQSALYVLQNGSIAPATVVFQAEFCQGSGVYTSLEDPYLGTTYFCYSSYPELYN